MGETWHWVWAPEKIRVIRCFRRFHQLKSWDVGRTCYSSNFSPVQKAFFSCMIHLFIMFGTSHIDTLFLDAIGKTVPKISTNAGEGWWLATLQIPDLQNLNIFLDLLVGCLEKIPKIHQIRTFHSFCAMGSNPYHSLNKSTSWNIQLEVFASSKTKAFLVWTAFLIFVFWVPGSVMVCSTGLLEFP